MKLIDITLPIPESQDGNVVMQTERVPLRCAEVPYEARVHHFKHDSMAGTYLDFPGHILETDDGLSALEYPLDRLYRVKAAVIHLARKNASGGISADELATAAPPLDGCGALVINALGETPFDGIDYRSVFLRRDAVEWITSTAIHLLVADVYESKTFSEGVFPMLFKRGISTVCHPIQLHRLDQPHVCLTVLAPRFANATQLPCRVVAEVGI